MPVPKRHPLVRADLQSAYDWYDEQEAGIGARLAVDFLATYRTLCARPEHFAVRFSGIRRINLSVFPYGIFYVVVDSEIRILAVLHSKRRHRHLLSGRRKSFESSRARSRGAEMSGPHAA